MSQWRTTGSWVAVAAPAVATALVAAFVTEWTGTLPGGPGTWALAAGGVLAPAVLADAAKVGRARAAAALRPVAVGGALLLCALGVHTLLLPSQVLAGQADRSAADSLRGLVGLAVIACLSAALVGPLSRGLRADGHLTDRQITADFRRRLRGDLPREELLLQLGELLHAELAPAGVEIWLAEGNRLIRRVSLPNRPPATLALGEQEQAVACRTPIAGRRWLQVWIPALLAEEAGADGAADLRAVPLTH